MEAPELLDLELDLLLEAIFRRWGYDFRDYARASLRRRVELTRTALGVADIGALQHLVLHDRNAFDQLALHLSVCVTEFFRDPAFYLAVRDSVLPILASYPFIKIWSAGCATGEEVYSLAVLFEEAGLLQRTTFYGTDFNNQSLAVAREGIYPLEIVKKAQEAYVAAGGQTQLLDFTNTAYQSARFAERLRRRMVFSVHNLSVDQAFSEVQMVICRNVLIYFNRDLQDRALRLFGQALTPLGVLALGNKESLGNGAVAEQFKPLDARQRLFRKVN